jgi:hypothetical protein
VYTGNKIFLFVKILLEQQKLDIKFSQHICLNVVRALNIKCLK